MRAHRGVRRTEARRRCPSAWPPRCAGGGGGVALCETVL